MYFSDCVCVCVCVCLSVRVCVHAPVRNAAWKEGPCTWVLCTAGQNSADYVFVCVSAFEQSVSLVSSVSAEQVPARAPACKGLQPEVCV